ncbi:MAG: tetratricopeptide repeat protein [Woeseiaceae bacterium]
MNDKAPSGKPAKSRRRQRLGWQRMAIGLGATAALGSAVLAVLANLSEIAGWFAPDETRDLVEQTREAVVDTDAKVNELLNLLRNQAAAAGVDLNIESEVAIRNAIQTIIASANAQKQSALAQLDDGNVAGAAEAMTRIAANQETAVSATGEAAAATWREAGALYYSHNIAEAIHSYEQALRLEPGNLDTINMLGRSLLRGGRLQDASRILQEGMALDASPAQRASLQTGLGEVAKQLGNYVTATEYFSAAFDIAKREKLDLEQVDALLGLGVTARATGNLDLAESHYVAAEAVARNTGNDSLNAKIQTDLGVVEASRGNYDEAKRRIREALEIHRARYNLAGQANTIGNLGAIALLEGELDDAENLLLESVEIGEKLGWKESIAYDLVNLGGIAKERKAFEAADQYLARAELLSREADLAELIPVIVFNRGEIALEQGDAALACRFWREAEPVLTSMGSGHAETAVSRIASADCLSQAE